MWSASDVVLLLVATGESTAIVVLALVVRDQQREIDRLRAPPPDPPPESEPPSPPPRPVGFRYPG